MTVEILNLIVFVLFGLAVNIAAFAVYKYHIANQLHRERHHRQYAGALPQHIWKTSLGTILVLVGSVLLLLYVEEINVAHFILIGGFSFLAVGMHELLNFENHRINTLRRCMKVQVTDDEEEEV